MFSIRLSSVLYPTQLHRRNVCVHMCTHNSIDIIISTYTALWWSEHVLCVIRPGRNPKDEASAKKSQRPLGVVAAALTGSRGWFTAPSLHTRHQSSPSPPAKKKEEFIHRKSAVLLTDAAYITTAHAAATCFPPRYRAHGGDGELLGPTFRPPWHHSAIWAWLTGSLFVFPSKTESISCAPFVLDCRLKKRCPF